MRPPTHRQSALRAPLNQILGTEANVRLLRALSEHGAPSSPAELARRTLLQPTTVYRALVALEDAGIVEPAAGGAPARVALSTRHPLGPAIAALFAAERARADDLHEALQNLASSVKPPPVAVWLEGASSLPGQSTSDEESRGRGSEDERSAALILDVVASGSSLDDTTQTLRESVEKIEHRFDVTIGVRGWTLPDLEALPKTERERLSLAIPLSGLPPSAALNRDAGGRRGPGQTQLRAHADHDRRALALAAAIADKLARDPSLVERARAYIAKRTTGASSGERRELAEWDRLLRTASPARLRRFLVDPGERATRLRQTLPFLGLLTERERRQALVAASAETSDKTLVDERGKPGTSARRSAQRSDRRRKTGRKTS
jgi:DNA-binding transcriptional ArsR family regulator